MNKPKKVSSWEISRFMLDSGAALTAPEVTEAMRKQYPHLEVESRAVYMVMRSICFSNYSHSIIDKSVRPMTFKLHFLDDRFFLGRAAYNRMDSVSQQSIAVNDVDKEEQILKQLRLARSCFDAVVRKRQTSC